MPGKFNHNFSWNVVAGSLRKVINDDRKRGAIGDGAIVRKQVRGQHLFFVVMRGANHGDVISQLGGVLG